MAQTAGEVLAESIDQSKEVFMDSAIYRPFDLTKNFQRIVGCIDPRDEDNDQLKVMVQTPGGAGGEGHDASIALTVMRGKAVSVTEALTGERSKRLAVVLGAHHACKYLTGYVDVQKEEINPSDFTLDTMGRWASTYELHEDVMPRRKDISEAAARQQDELPTLNPNDVIEQVDKLYEPYANVATMVGDNNAHIYVVNHHPYVGLDRTRIHRELRLKIQGYHDSLRASVEGLKNTANISAEERRWRLAALFMRSAATRTVLGQLHADTVYLEVRPDDDGLKIEEAA